MQTPPANVWSSSPDHFTKKQSRAIPYGFAVLFAILALLISPCLARLKVEPSPAPSPTHLALSFRVQKSPLQISPQTESAPSKPRPPVHIPS